MVGESFKGLKIRTRSKVAKSLTCEILGYPIPASFQKVQPRFTGQNFDTYVQKSNNLQVWNEELNPSRRYVLIRTDEADIVTNVKVVTGIDLATLDTTGTLTQKYQAKLLPGKLSSEIISKEDTDNILPLIGNDNAINLSQTSPTNNPKPRELYSISSLHKKLSGLVGAKFKDVGHDQERNRGGELHKLVCGVLGYGNFKDDGQFPDIKHQLLEVKLQTSPTIDLGLVCPNSEIKLDMEKIQGINVRHCDVRYALFSAIIVKDVVVITNFYISTGQDFFSRFPQFGGKVLNRKLQIPLPKGFFGCED